ncbi:hypothetical protein FSARC_7916 [Fusarium sarcochroum]|uniref:Uncharacterized protein n=1 Tax=Fusarium sarcochroum TaxID=1208366 RepID=A0A8H4TUF5_9HYPO|nr:hypothetical protein FSARC_7916 [Fusarium sarcochroum]
MEQVNSSKRKMSAMRQVEKNWDKAIRAEKDRIEKDLPVITKEMYEVHGRPGCPEPTYDEIWNQEDEAELVQRYWTGTPLEAGISCLVSDNLSLNELFKVSLRIFGVDPITLFTLGTDDFEFDINTTVEVLIHDDDYLTPIWRVSFCKDLTSIMTHPIWCGRGRWSFMLFAIKWAVICRTDDRRPLPAADRNLLSRLNCPLGDDQTLRPYKDLHEEQQKILRGQNTPPSQQAELLSAIAKYTAMTIGIPSARNYTIIPHDLAAVIKGLDSLSLSGMMDCELFLQLFKDAGGRNEYPTEDETPALYKTCYLDMERRRLKAFKRRLRAPSAPPEKVVY